MVWGHQIEYLEGLQESLGITPKALLTRPELHELGGEIYTAFNTLSSSRGYGMSGPLALTIESMFAYCQMFYIDQVDERASFVNFMQRLDAAYLAAKAEQADNPSGSAVVDQEVPLDNPSPKG